MIFFLLRFPFCLLSQVRYPATPPPHDLQWKKFLLFGKVHLTVWWSLLLSYFHKGMPCLKSPNLITTISRHRYKEVPLELRGDQQSLEPFSTNDCYYRDWSSLYQFEITSIQIKPHSFVVAKGHPHMNTTLTSVWDWFKITTGHMMGSDWFTRGVYVTGDFFLVNWEGTSMLGT